jgi:hypothetical protein
MYTPPPRKPRRKLGLGDMFGLRNGGQGSDDATESTVRNRDEDSDDDKIKKYSPYIFMVILVFGAIQLFIKRDVELTKFNSENRIKEMEWNGTITKKYFYKESSDSTVPMHLLLEIKNKDGKKSVIDLKEETTDFWGAISPFATVTKPANSTKVHVKTYAGVQADLELKFE